MFLCVRTRARSLCRCECHSMLVRACESVYACVCVCGHWCVEVKGISLQLVILEAPQPKTASTEDSSNCTCARTYAHACTHTRAHTTSSCQCGRTARPPVFEMHLAGLSTAGQSQGRDRAFSVCTCSQCAVDQITRDAQEMMCCRVYLVIRWCRVMVFGGDAVYLSASHSVSQ